MKKSIIKHYIAGQANPIKEAMRVMECRAAEILDGNDWYKELYIDPYVDIVNSHPQVIQQVKNEIRDFLSVLKKNNINNLLQIGLGHWASTHFVLSILLDEVTTLEYDSTHIERYLPEACEGCETIIQGDSLELHKNIEDESFDAVFIDGNHSYEYVKQDLENYSKKVKSGGIIALHDANFEGEQYGTPQVLRESENEWVFISYSKEVGIAYRIKE